MADINLGVGGANSAVAGGYDIANSLKLESDNPDYIDNRHHTAGNRRTWTLSFWIKRTELGTTQKPYDAGFAASIAFLSTDKIQIENSNLYLATNRVFRDTSAWYHIVLLNDSTQSTASDRAKLWINGVQETSFSSETYMAQNEEGNMNSATSVSIGGGGGAHVNGYMAELFFVDGQALAPTDFGEFDEDSGIWKPKEYDGTLSGTSIKLDFSNSAALWEDSSGLTGNGTAMSGINITSADQATDTPTNNFCTWNVLPLYNSNIFSFPNGATEVKRTSGTGWTTAYSSLGVNKGKWYAEFQILTSGNYLMNGNVPLAKIQSVYATQFYLGSEASAAAGAGYYSSGTTGNDAIYHDATLTGSGVTTSAGDIISVAMDCDNNKIHFAVNGTYTNSSNPATNTNGFNMTDDYQFFAHATLTGEQTWKNNFGGYTTISISSAATDANGYGTFEYAPPSGYYALCTKNLAEYG
jgi:hypothetical protein